MPRCLLLTYSLLSLFVASSALAQNSISIEGTLLMLDDKTPHVAVPVQAIRKEGKRENEKTGKWESEERRERGQLIATTLSDENGKYRFINLKPGRYRLRCQVLGGYVYYRAADHALRFTFYDSEATESVVEDGLGDVLNVPRGKTLKNIDFRFAPFKKGTWRNYSTLDGLAGNLVYDMYRGPDGVMWFGTHGVSRYDGKAFINLTTKDGLGLGDVFAIDGDPDGVVWFGTYFGGVSRYDGKEFVNITVEDGLLPSSVLAIHRDSNGIMWFGTWAGVSRYDGRKCINFTTQDGLVHNSVRAICSDRDGVVWFGTWGGVSRYDGKEFVNFTTEDGLPGNRVHAIHRDPDGVMWFGTWGGVSRYDGKEFANFTTEDGLADNSVNAIYRDPDGAMWFGTEGGGVSRYDGEGFVNFTTQDGLARNSVRAIYRDPDGVMWFATWGGGVSRYDARRFTNFTRRDGLVHNNVHAIHRDPDGVLWFGTYGGGVSRYDGKEFVNFTTEDGLVHNNVHAIDSDPDGVIWFATGGGWGDGAGISRYDGSEFVNFTSEDGLANNNVWAVHCDPDGMVWFGTRHGLSRYDGSKFVNFTTEDGLAHNYVFTIYRDPDGVMWFGTHTGGVSRYDGKEFVNFTTEDGLVDDRVLAIQRGPDGVMWFGTFTAGVSRYDDRGMGDCPHFVNFTTEDGLAQSVVNAIHCDPDGAVWFATWGGGVSVYDGVAWTSLDTRDGLAGNNVWSIHRDADGLLWFGTEDGITLYRRSTTPPRVYIVSVTTDRTYRLKTQDSRLKTQDARRKTEGSSIPAFTLGTRVTIEYDSIDFKTIPEKRQYRCRVSETSDVRHQTSDREVESQVSGLKSGVSYNPPTRNTTFDWTPREPGTYTFQVQAIDRDLNYSEPASLVLSVVPPFYLRAAFLIPTIGSGAIALAIVVFLATALTKRRRQVHAYQQLAVEELQDAREMQMSLLPEAAPPVEGMEIAGRSTPANTVGGDFFDYLTLEDGKVGIAMADISGKGLRAAMNAVMTSGMLYEVVKTEMSCGSILLELNAGLCPRMERQTFAAFSFAILSENSERIQWSNAAQPRPLIKRGDSVSEVPGEGELPLGIMPDVAYPDHELELQTGDIVVLYTDGVIEAENEAEEMYGVERLEVCVAGIDPAMGAEKVIEAILKDVSDFAGSTQQYDDMTIVVVKKL